LSFSYRFPTTVKDDTIAPSFTIDELAYFKGSWPLVGKIEKVLIFIRGKGHSVKMSPSGLEIKKNILTASLSLQFSFQEPSLRPFISSRLSGLFSVCEGTVHETEAQQMQNAATNGIGEKINC
jgi:hypothetical protein